MIRVRGVVSKKIRGNPEQKSRTNLNIPLKAFADVDCAKQFIFERLRVDVLEEARIRSAVDTRG
jgi:hypothetical protein